MRTGLVTAVCILAVVLVCGLLNQALTSEISHTYTDAAEELRALCEKKDWQYAMDTVDAHRQTWQKTERMLQMLINHEETDEVTMALLNIRAGIEAQDAATCFAGCCQLQEAAAHLYHRDAFTLGNIL